MSNFAIFRDAQTQGTDAPAEIGSFQYRTNFAAIYNDLNISLASGILTFGTAGIYAIRVRAQHFGPSARKFVHVIEKNNTPTGLPSTPVQTDGLSNWTSTSANIVSLSIGDTIRVASVTNTGAGTFAGKAAGVASEVYTEIEIEKLGAAAGALFYYSKASGTAGDNEAVTYTKRTLVSSVNSISGMSLSTGSVVFPSGNYRIRTVCTHSGIALRKAIHTFNGASTGAIMNNIGNSITESISFLNTTGVTLTLQSKVDSIATTAPTMGKANTFGGTLEVYGLVDIVKI